MTINTLVKGCNCEHCLKKLKQINQSRDYWAKIIVIKNSIK